MPMLPQVKKEESPLLNEDKLNSKMQEVFNFYKNSINEPKSLTTKIDQTLKQADALLKYEPKDEKEKELYLKNLLFYKNYLQNLRSRLAEGYIVLDNKLKLFNQSDKIDLIESKIKNYQTIENYKDLDSYYSKYFDVLESSLIEDKGKKVFPFKNLISFQELIEIVSNDNKTKYWKFETKESMEAFKQGLENLFEKNLIKNAPIILQNNMIGLNIQKETRKEIKREPQKTIRKEEKEEFITFAPYNFKDIYEAKLVYGAKQTLTYSRFFNPNQLDKTLLNKLAEETLNQFLTDNNTTLEEFKNKSLDEKKKLLSKFEVVGYATVESSKQVEENQELANRRGELLRNAIVDLIAANEGEKEDLKQALKYRGELVSWFTIEGKVSSEKANKRLNAAIKALQNDSSLESQIALLILQGKYEEAKKEAKQKKDLDLVARINQLQKTGGNPAITIDENGNASITNQALLEKILKRQDLGGLRYEEIMVNAKGKLILNKPQNLMQEVGKALTDVLTSDFARSATLESKENFKLKLEYVNPIGPLNKGMYNNEVFHLKLQNENGEIISIDPAQLKINLEFKNEKGEIIPTDIQNLPEIFFTKKFDEKTNTPYLEVIVSHYVPKDYSNEGVDISFSAEYKGINTNVSTIKNVYKTQYAPPQNQPQPEIKKEKKPPIVVFPDGIIPVNIVPKFNLEAFTLPSSVPSTTDWNFTTKLIENINYELESINSNLRVRLNQKNGQIELIDKKTRNPVTNFGNMGEANAFKIGFINTWKDERLKELLTDEDVKAIKKEDWNNFVNAMSNGRFKEALGYINKDSPVYTALQNGLSVLTNINFAAALNDPQFKKVADGSISLDFNLGEGAKLYAYINTATNQLVFTQKNPREDQQLKNLYNIGADLIYEIPMENTSLAFKLGGGVAYQTTSFGQIKLDANQWYVKVGSGWATRLTDWLSASIAAESVALIGKSNKKLDFGASSILVSFPATWLGQETFALTADLSDSSKITGRITASQRQGITPSSIVEINYTYKLNENVSLQFGAGGVFSSDMKPTFHGVARIKVRF